MDLKVKEINPRKAGWGIGSQHQAAAKGDSNNGGNGNRKRRKGYGKGKPAQTFVCHFYNKGGCNRRRALSHMYALNAGVYDCGKKKR